MNIAVVTFNTDAQHMTGIIAGPIYLWQTLNAQEGVTADLIATHPKGENDLDIVQYPNANECIPEYLNKYDFIIFATPGYRINDVDSVTEPMYTEMLTGLTTPFGITINAETDYQTYPKIIWDELTSHPYYRVLFLNAEESHNDFTQILPKDGTYIEFNFMIPMSLKEVVKNAVAKMNEPNRIISTARWIPIKRVAELVDLAPKFKENGIELLVAGDRRTYFYYRDILANHPEDWTDLGSFNLEDLPEMLKNVKYHYGMMFLKRITKKRTALRHRLELVTLEALMHGCLPVLCDQLAPSWIGSTGPSAIVLNKDEMDRLPDIIASISPEEYVSRVKTFYNEVRINIWSKYQDAFIPTLQKVIDSYAE